VRIATCSKCTRAATPRTRSPECSSNPLGLHRVTVREVSGTRLLIGPIEAIDGTPVVDVKAVLVDCADG